MADATKLAREPAYDVLAKWSSPSYDAVTRAVIARRLDTPPPRRFFTAAQFEVLEAACARLLATAPGGPPIASAIDDDLHAGRGEGFRRPHMPPARLAWRIGLDGLDAETRDRHDGTGFAALDGAAQDAMLHALQRGDVDRSRFPGLAARRFFTDVLLKAVVGHYYSRPEAWNEIGFGGPASPRGYVRIGLDRRDPWEAPFAPRPPAKP
jgi:gluconate 2-dehydrogenase subunit 3-like protein